MYLLYPNFKVSMFLLGPNTDPTAIEVFFAT